MMSGSVGGVAVGRSSAIGCVYRSCDAKSRTEWQGWEDTRSTDPVGARVGGVLFALLMRFSRLGCQEKSVIRSSYRIGFLSSSFFAIHVSNPLSLKGEGVTLRSMLRSVTVIVTPL